MGWRKNMSVFSQWVDSNQHNVLSYSVFWWTQWRTGSFLSEFDLYKYYRLIRRSIHILRTMWPIPTQPPPMTTTTTSHCTYSSACSPFPWFAYLLACLSYRYQTVHGSFMWAVLLLPLSLQRMVRCSSFSKHVDVLIKLVQIRSILLWLKTSTYIHHILVGAIGPIMNL